MENQLQRKPHYTGHRRKISVADSADLAVLQGTHAKAAIHAGGYESLQGFVLVEGTVSPTVTLQPVELVEYLDSAGVLQQKFIARGSNIGPLATGASFALDTPGGGRWFLRVHALGGTNPVAHVFLSGGVRANEGSL